jgi:hypothetical protein
MSKYTVHTCIDDVYIYAELDTLDEMHKVADSLLPEPEPEPEPEPAIYLDAAGKEFDLFSLLAFKMDSGELYLIRIHTMEWSRDTNRWSMEVQRLTGSDDMCGNYVNLSGIGGEPSPQLFKMEATFQECMAKELI